jgi:Mg-chelatase subunit ChlD
MIHKFDAQAQLNAVDLAFVVDTTSSMGGMIASAQQHMIEVMEAVVKSANLDLQLGVVEYRDHPPQERTFVYRLYPFTGDLQKARKTIQNLKVMGGGDAPEAVLDGVLAACNELEWRKHARRLLVLVGDAPPHGGFYAADSFRDGCPCGETIESVTAAAENRRVAIYTLGLNSSVTEAFSRISAFTGGEYFEAKQTAAAIEKISEILKSEFAEIEFDRLVLERWQVNPDATYQELADALDSTRHAVGAALMRLNKRDLLELPVLAA